MAKKSTAAKRNRARAKAALNPLTGQPANAFTKAYRSDPEAGTSVIRDGVTSRGVPVMSRPVSKKPMPSGGPEVVNRRARMEQVKSDPASPLDAPLGYRWADPKDLERLASEAGGSDAAAEHARNQLGLIGWISGAQRSFPRQTGPAINEPHETPDDLYVPRRLEDMNASEYRHAEQAARTGGYPRTNPLEGMVGTQMRNMVRVMGENTAAGTDENVSQLFYGGEPTTHVHDPDLAVVHKQKVAETPNRFHESTAEAAQMVGTSDARHARSVAALAAADTSPNTKWREGSNYPNLNAADEAIRSVSEDRPLNPKAYAPSRPANVAKTRKRLSSVVTDEVPTAVFGDPNKAPKTMDFRNALTEHDSPDSRTVTDIMEGHQVFPNLTTSKALLYERLDPQGQRIGSKIAVHPNSAKPRGATPVMETTETGKVRQAKGQSEVEEVVNDRGQSLIHAANDYAARRVNTALGISRGVNYADNVNMGQAARWGSEQVSRPDVRVSDADQYPVIRDWQAEGTTLGGARPEHAKGSQWDWMYETKSVDPQWAQNPNTKWSEGSAIRSKPYPKMPGE